MPKNFPDLKILVLLVVAVSIFTACEHEKPTTPTATETPPAELQQSPDATSESEAPEASTEQPAVAETTPQAAEKTASSEAQSTQPDNTSEAAPESSADANNAQTGNAQTESLALARKSGCLACHAVDKKVVGPPWRDVARRYAGNPEARAQLIEKVSKGGKGNWTDVVGNVAMPPYSPRVSKANIEKLVDFVLSLSSQ
jgi:cytochrome c